MADILLRERAKVLGRTLDAVERVIDVLEHSRRLADTRPKGPNSMAATLDAMQSGVGELRMRANGAQFAPGTKPAFDVALAGVEAYLQELGRQLQTPAMTSRVTVRLDQLVGSLSDAVNQRREELDGLAATLNAPGGLPDEAARARAWEKCLQIEADCGRLFADYLDLVRGVALRDSGLDDGLCRIADELVLELGPFGSISWKSLTVPASRERYDSPVASFVRIGFPEWSVWTLPLAAVEFASFLIALNQRFSDLHKEVTEALGKLIAERRVVVPDQVLASLVDRRQLPADPEIRASFVRTAFERLTGMLLVEALATAVIGPAYAWSALLMRVHPQQGYDLIERLRRDTVVGTLESLKVERHEAARKDLLQSEWDALLASVGGAPSNGLHQALAEIVPPIIDGVLARVSFRLRDADWALIERLADKLTETRPAVTVLQEISEEHFRPQLRHLLNAGWVARLAKPEIDRAEPAAPQGPPLLSRAVLDVCVALLDGAGATPTSVTPGTGWNPTLPQAAT
jgi:hypothetical protein